MSKFLNLPYLELSILDPNGVDRASDMSMSDDETATGGSDEKTIEEMKRNEIINSLKNKTLILIKNDLIKAIEKDVEKVYSFFEFKMALKL